MNTLITYLTERVSQTGWNFVPLTELTNRFGDTVTRQELNQLHKAGKIRKRVGGNGDLIELIINNEL
jgi:hypothetical protein